MKARSLAVKAIRMPLLLALASCMTLGVAATAKSQSAPTQTAFSTSQPATPTPTVVTPTTTAPVSPPPTVTPSAIPAELVSVTDLTAVETADLIGPGGLPRRPEEVTATVSLAWSSPPEFRGAFEVERATRRYSYSELGPFERIGTQSLAGGGKGFLESMPLTSRPAQSCYRVRAMAGGVAGPYSNVACTIIPPSSGRVATPGPPDTGSAGLAEQASMSHLWLVGAAAALFGAASLAVLTISRR